MELFRRLGGIRKLARRDRARDKEHGETEGNTFEPPFKESAPKKKHRVRKSLLVVFFLFGVYMVFAMSWSFPGPVPSQDMPLMADTPYRVLISDEGNGISVIQRHDGHILFTFIEEISRVPAGTFIQYSANSGHVEYMTPLYARWKAGFMRGGTLPTYLAQHIPGRGRAE